jgi:hypothetical protein
MITAYENKAVMNYLKRKGLPEKDCMVKLGKCPICGQLKGLREDERGNIMPCDKCEHTAGG